MAALDLTTISGALVEEAGRIDQEVLQNGLYTAPWVDLIDNEVFPEGVGDEISRLIYEPTRYGALTWNKVAAADASGKTIIPTASTITAAKSDVSFFLEHVALESQKLNLNDFRTAVVAEAQMNAIYENLTFNTHRLLEERNRSEYIRVAATKVVADSLTSPSEGTITSHVSTMPTGAATLELSNALLAKYRMRILKNGGGKYAYDKVDNAPVFCLVCDSDVSYALKNELGDNLRFAARANELLSPYGCDGVYQNFYHLIDDNAPRYTWSGSVWTEVTPETNGTADDGGTKRIPNTAYDTAPFTDSVILVKNVMTQAVPKSGGGAGMAQFAAQNYRGQWAFKNVENVDSTSPAYNPDRAIGFFRGVFAMATKPGLTQLGVVVRHYRPGYAP